MEGAALRSGRKREPENDKAVPPQIGLDGGFAPLANKLSFFWLRGSIISSLVLREAKPGDAGLILELIRELAVFERLEQECVADAALLRHFLFEDKKAHAIVAEWDGRPAGFALYFYNFSTFVGRPGLYLEDLFVRPAFRRNGIARAIFHWLAKKAVAEGCGRFEWSVLDWNENAIAFYRALGAKPMDEWIIQRLTGEALRRVADGHQPS